MKTPEKVGAVAQYRYGDNRFLNITAENTCFT